MYLRSQFIWRSASLPLKALRLILTIFNDIYIFHNVFRISIGQGRVHGMTCLLYAKEKKNWFMTDVLTDQPTEGWMDFLILFDRRPPSKIITIIFSDGNRWFPMPTLVLKMIIMIKKVYGLEICVFMALLRGATSGLWFSAVFSLF